MDKGILLIHGLAGNIDEIRPLKEYLEKKNYFVRAPILSGHESTRRNLARSTFIDWIESAKRQLTYLEERCDSIIIIGFSMGGLIGVNLSIGKDNIKKLILINTPYKYWNFPQIFKNLKNDFKNFSKRYILNIIKIPFRTLINFKKILNKTKKLFPKVKSKVYIFQTLDDDTVKPKSKDLIYNNIKGEKYIKKYKTGGHKVLISDNKIIFKDIEKILSS